MKKIFLILALSVGVILTTFAQLPGNLQNAVNKVSTTAKSAGIDVNASTNSVMTKLTSALSLSKVQVPDVQKSVTNYLEQKSSILNLSATDKAKYTAKANDLISGLQTKLKTNLSKDQFTKFLGLKPAKNTPSNPLSQLFY
jgi:hypothetical protein